MPRLLFLLVALVWVNGAIAQVIINQDDMPRSGDTLRYSEASTANFQIPDLEGQSLVWDYRTLTPVKQGIENYAPATALSPAYATAFGPGGYYGRKVQDSLRVGNTFATDLHEFYHPTATAFSAIGRGVSFRGNPTGAFMADSDKIYTLPMRFGQKDSTTFKVQYNLNGLATYAQAGYRVNKVLGQGQITTPLGTFQAIAVWVRVYTRDTLKFGVRPIPFVVTNSSASIVWLAKGQHYPVLEIILTNEDPNIAEVQRVRYADSARLVGVVPLLPNFVAPRRILAVNDSIPLLNLTTTSGPAPLYFWGIRPFGGWSFTLNTNASSRQPYIKFRGAGIYTISLSATYDTTTLDLEKTDYIIVGSPVEIAKTQSAPRVGYPNPATDAFTLAMPAALAYDGWYMADVQGKRYPMMPEKGAQGLKFCFTGLPAGIYVLVAQRGTTASMYQTRVIVLRQ